MLILVLTLVLPFDFSFAKTCPCYICEPSLYWNTTSNSIPQSNKRVIFVQEGRLDGLGSSVGHVIYSSSFSFNKNWTWGGLTSSHVSHGVNIDYAISQLFYGGLSLNHVKFNETKFNLSADVPTFSTTNELAIRNIDNILAVRYKNDTTVIVIWKNYVFNRRYAVLDKPFIQALRLSTSCGVQHLLKKSHSHFLNPRSHRVLTIAAHIRLGDTIGMEDRWIPFSWYHQVFLILLDLYPVESQFHIYSSVLLEDHTSEHAVHAEFSQDSRLVSRIHYHILRETQSPEKSENATEDANQTRTVLHDWAHMITANVLITAKSSFSFVPAMINENCVLYHQSYQRPLDDWIVLPEQANGTDILNVMKTEVAPCIDQVLSKKKKNNDN